MHMRVCMRVYECVHLCTYVHVYVFTYHPLTWWITCSVAFESTNVFSRHRNASGRTTWIDFSNHDANKSSNQELCALSCVCGRMSEIVLFYCMQASYHHIDIVCAECI
jgi:hypothetical protein